MRGRPIFCGGDLRKKMSPSGRRQRVRRERGGTSTERRRVRTGTLPSSPTRTEERRLQTKRHQGQAGGGRSSRWISCALAWARMSRRACFCSWPESHAWGEASYCQSAPKSLACQRRTGLAGFL